MPRFTGESKGTVIVIGGGLVGALCVCLLAEKGYNVEMYEKRDDIRKSKVKKGRSINLALSHRGRKALRMIGIESEVLKNAIPMRGRFIHNITGDTKSVPYDSVTKQCIFSVGRTFLNQIILDVAEKYENVKLFFNHKLLNANFDDNSVTFTKSKTNITLTITADLIVGADGASSTLRNFMQKTPMFDFSETYIEHGYLELAVPSEKGHMLQPNHLHIWPRGKFMMIALPNQDHSWTVTLFMPFKNFEAIDTGEEVLSFFKSNFADCVSLIGEKELMETFLKNKPSYLVSIKCGHYHASDRFLIIGDAAHAMVPFYGQGMNAGFEDCSILSEILDVTHGNISQTVKAFSERRKDDLHAICDLAMYNYIEMRDLVTKPSFKLRNILDRLLVKTIPKIWFPLYSSVSFSHMPYKQCVENRKWQDKVLIGILLTMMMCVLLAWVL